MAKKMLKKEEILQVELNLAEIDIKTAEVEKHDLKQVIIEKEMRLKEMEMELIKYQLKLHIQQRVSLDNKVEEKTKKSKDYSNSLKAKYGIKSEGLQFNPRTGEIITKES